LPRAIMTNLSPIDAELQQGIALWEAGQYLAALEEFELLWRAEVGRRRNFLRALIHAAMGFHYVTVGDTVSAYSKLGSAGSLLEGFAGDFLGLDIDGLRRGIAIARTLLSATEKAMAGELRQIRIPRLTMVSSGVPLRETQ
ncbi:MAG TPA: DUF309 domain-containing protein, partial [Candidatus Acidoferrum sp.]|nr:DUF309 domain-containing protein [Candidatus Acidoferrum sp.]